MGKEPEVSWGSRHHPSSEPLFLICEMGAVSPWGLSHRVSDPRLPGSLPLPGPQHCPACTVSLPPAVSLERAGTPPAWLTWSPSVQHGGGAGQH